MMYLLTTGWFLAHTSLAMTPRALCNQWRVLVSEICKSRALQEHVPLITQSSSVTEPTQLKRCQSLLPYLRGRIHLLCIAGDAWHSALCTADSLYYCALLPQFHRGHSWGLDQAQNHAEISANTRGHTVGSSATTLPSSMIYNIQCVIALRWNFTFTNAVLSSMGIQNLSAIVLDASHCKRVKTFGYGRDR